MREFPLHKLTIRYNATMFTYDLPCGSSPYINWLYGTMAQCLRTIYHEGVPLHKVTIRNNCTMFPMREFPLHKLTIRYNATMFTYDLPCGSSPYIWLYGTMPQCLRTIYHAGVPLWHKLTYTMRTIAIRYNVYVRFTMREFPLHKLTIRYNATMFTYDLPCGSSPYIDYTVDNVYVRYHGTMTIRYTMFTYDLPCGSSPYINWLYGTMPQRTMRQFPLHKLMFTYNLPCGIYHAVRVPLT